MSLLLFVGRLSRGIEEERKLRNKAAAAGEKVDSGLLLHSGVWLLPASPYHVLLYIWRTGFIAAAGNVEAMMSPVVTIITVMTMLIYLYKSKRERKANRNGSVQRRR